MASVFEYRPASELEPGDRYLRGSSGSRELREVLGVLQRGAFGSVLLEVRKATGDVVRTRLEGRYDVLVGEAV